MSNEAFTNTSETSVTTFRPDQIRYEIQETLGEGLNSKVLKAIRIDSAGQSRQTVALKFLKDQSSVPFLRREFETLLAVRSNHCARVISWETQGPDSVLALEWIDGLTLFDFAQFATRNGAKIEHDVCNQIVRQIFLGLQDLQSAGLYHGDLQPKNIMIDRRGSVRLIDFASGRCADGSFQATPAFLDPSASSDDPFSFEADLYALNVIRKHLPSAFRDVESERLAKIRSTSPRSAAQLYSAHCGDTQIAIANLVNEALCQKADGCTTQILRSIDEAIQDSSLHRKVESPRLHLRNAFVAAAVLTLLTLAAPGRAEAPAQTEVGTQQGLLEFRSLHWMQVSVNGRAIGYAPAAARGLQAGTHRISWKSALGEGETRVNLSAGQTLRFVETQSHAGEFKVR